MPNTNVEDEELRKKIRDEWLIHEEDCQYSMFDIPCDCIQDDVSKNIMQLIAARERALLDALEKEGAKLSWPEYSGDMFDDIIKKFRDSTKDKS